MSFSEYVHDQARFVQCTLLRRVGTCGGVEVKVAFIPEKYAILGDTLKIKHPVHGWIDGYIVDGIGQSATKDDVTTLSRDFKRTRKASDLPKGTFKK